MLAILLRVLSQADAAPGRPKLARTPMSSGIPNKTYRAGQLFMNVVMLAPFGTVIIFSPNFISPLL